MTTITITECKRDGQTWTSTHRTDDVWEATDRAVKRVFGKAASFARDNGISVGRSPADGRQYGQVTAPIRNNPGAHNCLTGRVSIDAA
jgi:hypothetical protein